MAQEREAQRPLPEQRGLAGCFIVRSDMNENLHYFHDMVNLQQLMQIDQ